MRILQEMLANRWGQDEMERTSAILRFQLPLGATAVLMASSFSIMNTGLARTDHPEVALAAFALGQTVTNMFASPVWIARQLLVAFSSDGQSMRAAVRVTVGIAGLVLAWLAVLAFTPAGHLVYVRIFGAGEEIFPEVLSVVRLCLALPFVHFARVWSQAILMRQRKTSLMTWAMIARLAAMAALAVYLPGFNLVQGAAVGAAIWIMGMAVESIFCITFALPMRDEVYDSTPSEKEDPATGWDCIRFLWPLIIQGILLTFALPAINSGLARTATPERNLAVFQVAWSIAFLFIAFIYVHLSQAIVVLLEDLAWWRSLKRTGLWLAGLDSAAMLLLVLSGLSDWILLNIIGVEAHLVPPTRSVLLVMSAAPLLGGLVELRMGLAMRRQQTVLLAVAKSIDMMVLLTVIIILSTAFPALGPNAGPLAFIAGMMANYLFLRRKIREPTEAAMRAGGSNI